MRRAGVLQIRTKANFKTAQAGVPVLRGAHLCYSNRGSVPALLAFPAQLLAWLEALFSRSPIKINGFGHRTRTASSGATRRARHCAD